MSRKRRDKNLIRINPDRPIEELSGDNRGMVHLFVDRCHVGESILTIAREARPDRATIQAASPELRRGWALCVISRHLENRQTYVDVMGGTFV